MQKTRLGISVPLMGLIVCLCGMFAGYTVAILVAGYILLAEENIWLRKTAAKVIALMLAFSVLSAIVGLIPDVWGVIENFIGIFKEYFYVSFIDRIFNFLSSVVSLARFFVFALLSYKALTQGTIKVPVVDTILNKHFN